MIDLKTGIIEFDGVRITPNTTIEELKKYGEDVIEINERGNGPANATLKKLATGKNQKSRYLNMY